MSAINVFSRSALFSAAILAGSVMSTGAASAAVTKAQLAGNWTAALGGNTGCGSSSMYVQFNLNTGGNGTATIIMHSTGCADSTSGGNAIKVTNLQPNGFGLLNLSCGVGCGWNFRIQVSDDANSMILVDVDPANPNNTPFGTALRRAPTP